jgi:hypothetical protein
MARKVEREHLQDRPAEPSAGNLFEPMAMDGRISGGWRRPSRTSPALGPAVATLAVVGLGLAAWWLARSTSRTSRVRLLSGLRN